MMFYALYYGVLARDVAEICTEKMVAGIGVCISLLTYFQKIRGRKLFQIGSETDPKTALAVFEQFFRCPKISAGNCAENCS